MQMWITAMEMQGIVFGINNIKLLSTTLYQMNGPHEDSRPVSSTVFVRRQTFLQNWLYFLNIKSTKHDVTIPVVGVIVRVARRGVDIITYQPIVVGRADADPSLLFIGKITSICIKVPQNHNVLQNKNNMIYQ